MSGFGDYEPEDAWDATDTPAQQIINLFRRMALVDGQPEPRTSDLPARLDMLEDRIRRARRSGMDPRTAHRLAQLVEDVGFVRGRI